MIPFRSISLALVALLAAGISGCKDKGAEQFAAATERQTAALKQLAEENGKLQDRIARLEKELETRNKAVASAVQLHGIAVVITGPDEVVTPELGATVYVIKFEPADVDRIASLDGYYSLLNTISILSARAKATGATDEETVSMFRSLAEYKADLYDAQRAASKATMNFTERSSRGGLQTITNGRGEFTCTIEPNTRYVVLVEYNTNLPGSFVKPVVAKVLWGADPGTEPGIKIGLNRSISSR